jgi:cyanate lyase
MSDIGRAQTGASLLPLDRGPYRMDTRHRALVAFLIESRRKAGLTQADVAKRLGRYQSFVALIEAGQRRVDVIEFLDFAEAIGFDPQRALRRIVRSK